MTMTKTRYVRVVHAHMLSTATHVFWLTTSISAEKTGAPLRSSITLDCPADPSLSFAASSPIVTLCKQHVRHSLFVEHVIECGGILYNISNV